jgi:apolipoprotein N-acyltransferase
VRQGARFLVNVTNDQWFGRSPAPYQHLTMGVFRAVENRVGIARAANTGVSCIIEPTGRITHATPLFQPGTIHGSVRLGHGTTFYNRHGDWILGVSAGLTGLLLLAPARRRRS